MYNGDITFIMEVQMQDKIIEKEMRKRCITLVENLEEGIKEQLEALSETLANLYTLQYFQYTLKHCKEKRDNKKAPQ